MSKRESQALVTQAKKYRLVEATIQGKPSASSESLSRSYALPIEDVRRIMRRHGVADHG